MEEWVAYYKQYEPLILFVAAWVLSIPTGIFIARLDTYLKNRSKERKIKVILTYHAKVIIEGREMIETIRSDFRNDFRSFIFKVMRRSPALRMLFLTFVIVSLQAFSGRFVTAIYGKTVSDWYFYITLALTLFLNIGVNIYADNQDSIFKDAIDFDKYKQKAIAQLKELGANPKELDGVENIARRVRK